VLEVLAHADLAHEAVLVAVHARQLPHVREDVLQPVRELEGVDVAQPVLHVRVHHELGQPQDLAAEVEGVAEARLLALLGGQRLHGLEVEVVVEVEVVDVFAVDEEVEHVVALPADLQAGLDPVDLRALEELSRGEGAEEVLLVERLARLAVQLVEHVALEQLLVADAHLDRVLRRAVLLVPAVHQGHVHRAARAAGALVEGLGRPEEPDRRRRQLRVERHRLQQRLEAVGQRKVEAVAKVVAHAVPLGRRRRRPLVGLELGGGGDGVDDRVVVEGRQVRVVRLDEDARRVVVDGHVHVARPRVEEVRERDPVLGAHRLADDDLVDVVELVPVVVVRVQVAVQRLELGPARDGHVERLCGEEGAEVKHVVVVRVRHVAQQLRGEAVERAHHGERELPATVRRPVHHLGEAQREVLVEPARDRAVLVGVELDRDRLERLDVEDVVAVVERRLLVVEGREAHALKVPPVPLLAPHHDPHRAPLRDVDRLDHLRHLVHKRDRAGHVVEDVDHADLLPRHRHVLEELEDRVRDVLERAQVHPLVVPELFGGHVAVVLHNLAQVLGRHLLLLVLRVAKLALLRVALGVELQPLARLLLQLVAGRLGERRSALALHHRRRHDGVPGTCREECERSF
jgi:hypothetical protein